MRAAVPRSYKFNTDFNSDCCRFDTTEPAATLRSRTAGSQDESRCGAIHRLNVKCTHPAKWDGRYRVTT
jgi:hypothetical protein